MNRREVLAGAGLAVVGSLVGCVTRAPAGDGSTPPPTPDETGTPAPPAPFAHAGGLADPIATNGDFPADEQPADGFPPAFPDSPAAPDVDESTFETRAVNGEAVRLVPIDVAATWYRRSAARFVDARGLPQYAASHVYGSVMSTARLESNGGAIEGWNLADRVVTYCGCPHHLSLLRGAGLQKAGHTRVYALDEGYAEWSIRDYPMAGTRFAPEGDDQVTTWRIRGTLDRASAGEYVLATAADQYEATPVRGDGSFSLRLRLMGVSAETPVRVTTPTESVTRPLGTLAADGLQLG